MFCVCRTVELVSFTVEGLVGDPANWRLHFLCFGNSGISTLFKKMAFLVYCSFFSCAFFFNHQLSIYIYLFSYISSALQNIIHFMFNNMYRVLYFKFIWYGGGTSNREVSVLLRRRRCPYILHKQIDPWLSLERWRGICWTDKGRKAYRAYDKTRMKGQAIIEHSLFHRPVSWNKMCLGSGWEQGRKLQS